MFLKKNSSIKSMMLFLVMLISFFAVSSTQVSARSLIEEINKSTVTKTKEFVDVPQTHDFYSTIMNLAGRGIVNGYDDGRFGPDDKVTRAQVAVMLVNALKLDVSGFSSNFTDVPNNHWAAMHIATASRAGILNGYGNGKFGPEDKVTRAQLSVMVANAYNLDVDLNNIVEFTDVPSDHWAKLHINALSSNGIVGGYRDGRFGTNDSATRAQFTKFLVFAERVADYNTAYPVKITALDKKAEYVEITNRSTNTVDISGWKMVSETGNQSFTFPAGTLIKSYQTIRLTSGDAQGTGDFTMAYTYIWNDNTLDPAVLYDNNNNEVSRLTK